MAGTTIRAALDGAATVEQLWAWLRRSDGETKLFVHVGGKAYALHDSVIEGVTGISDSEERVKYLFLSVGEEPVPDEAFEQ